MSFPKDVVDDMVFLSIDIQPRPRRVWTEENKLPYFRDMEFTLDDLNDAVAFRHDVVVPNAVRLGEWAKQWGVPRILVHWVEFDEKNYKDEPRPHDDFKVTDDDIVIPKTERNAFEGSDIERVLKEIGRNIILIVGGQTKGCLGRTATSALEAGYKVYLIKDAAFDCSQKIREVGIQAVSYTRILDTEEFLKSVSE